MDNANPQTAADTYIRNEAAVVGAVIGQKLLTRYTVRRLLGVGAMGHVLEVRDSETGEESAVKCVPPLLAGSEAHMRTIQANYDLVKGLSHPHIASLRALERDPDNGQYYLIMELVRGSELSQWLTEQRAIQPVIPIETVCGIAEQIATALDYAHSCPVSQSSGEKTKKFGILHRDLKPANVMVEKGLEYRAGVPYIKIVDFGLAAQIQASLHSVSLTSLNKLAGTPVYMAPEQWEGRTLTRGVDQWALAVMIYEMSAGYRPFDGPTESVVMANVKNAAPVKPATLSTSQWNALKVAFSADRRKRYRSCVALVKALADADQRTCESMVATELPMPDEFAGMPTGNDFDSGKTQQGDTEEPAAPVPASGLVTFLKWFSVAALFALFVGGGVLAYVVMTDPQSPITAFVKNSVGIATLETKPATTTSLSGNPQAVAKKTNSADDAEANRLKQIEVSHQALTMAMEQITDQKSKRTWDRINFLLEKPVAMPANADHPSLAAAKKLLANAKAELAKAPAFEKKLKEAKDFLTANRNEDALKAFEDARALWPESGRFDEIFNGMKQARDAIAQARIEGNRLAFSDGWTKASHAKSEGKWDEIVRGLEPLVELEGISNHPNYAAAQKLLKDARTELELVKRLNIVQEFVNAKRFEDALSRYNELLKQPEYAKMKETIATKITSTQNTWNQYKEDVKKEAALR